MKIRNGFVSNSSSSSFVIKKSVLSEEQLQMIRGHVDYKKYHYWDIDKIDEWNITESNDSILGYTIIDNFNMNRFLEEEVGVKDKDIKWEDF